MIRACLRDSVRAALCCRCAPHRYRALVHFQLTAKERHRACARRRDLVVCCQRFVAAANPHSANRRCAFEPRDSGVRPLAFQKRAPLRHLRHLVKPVVEPIFVHFQEGQTVVWPGAHCSHRQGAHPIAGDCHGFHDYCGIWAPDWVVRRQRAWNSTRPMNYYRRSFHTNSRPQFVVRAIAHGHDHGLDGELRIHVVFPDSRHGAMHCGDVPRRSEDRAGFR